MSPAPDADRARRGRRNSLLLAALFAVIAIANAVRALVDASAGSSWIVAALFAVGAVCFLLAARAGRGRR